MPACVPRCSRYVNVLPYDYNRVKIFGEKGHDYINASTVQVTVRPAAARPRPSFKCGPFACLSHEPVAALQNGTGETAPWRYIAAQGPLASTIDDFWHMVVQNKCTVLIMLTRSVENNHTKCAEYFSQRTGVRCKR
jgi:receptor-type tyrosine-protein phosphatase C